MLKLLIIDLVVVRIAIAIYEMALALEASDSISRVTGCLQRSAQIWAIENMVIFDGF